MNKAWKLEEIELLKANYVSKSREELAKLFPDKTMNAILHKAMRLNLKKIYWTDNELNTLKNVYPHMSQKELLRVLPNQDWTSIRHKAFDLKLTKAPHMRYSANWKNRGDVNVKLTDVQKGYVAAIIDGEGMIRVAKAHDHRWKEDHFYLAPLISIVNTDAKLMAKLREMLKVGRFYKETRKDERHKDKLVYNISSINGCKQILEQIKEELVIKKRQAEAVLKLIAIKEQKTSGAVTPEEIAIFDQIKQFNARGNGNA